MVLEHPDMMAAVLAHEIKNPAALAMAYVGLLRHASQPAEVTDYCNRIQQSLMDISELVQDLLFAAHSRPEPCCVDVADMLAEMLDEYRAAFCGRFLLTAAPGLVCYTYEQHLRLIFSNLLKNAVEAAGPAGRITVYAAMAGDCLRVEICNASVVARPKLHGNGMGLGICHWLLAQIGGELQIENGADECTVIVAVPVDFRQDKR